MVNGVTSTRSATATGAAQRAAFRLQQSLGRRLDPSDPKVVRQAATQLTAELFFAPLLAEMRKFPFGRDLATGGQTEAAFGQQLDQRIAESVAESDGQVVSSVVRQLEATGAAARRGARA